MSRLSRTALFSAAILSVVPAVAQERPIQDNSFLIEEAYNQERGVVQHISTLSRMWNSKDFGYTFTQEWPGPRNPRIQVSYTLVDMHSGAYGAASAGFGDVALNYRFQLVGNGDSRVAVAPRISALLPTGDVAKGHGSGGFGAQCNLPVSVALSHRLVSHWNAGFTSTPRSRAADGSRAAAMGHNVGASLVFLAHPRFNVLLEGVRNSFQSVVGPGQTEWSRTTLVSPGIRWAHDFPSGLQIVPGIAMPMGVGGSRGERGVFLYLSLEHPLRHMR